MFYNYIIWVYTFDTVRDFYSTKLSLLETKSKHPVWWERHGIWWVKTTRMTMSDTDERAPLLSSEKGEKYSEEKTNEKKE